MREGTRASDSNTSQRELTILVTASGSGGHLFPAAFIIQAIKELNASTTIRFIGSGRELEREIVGARGVPLDAIDVVGLKNRGIRGILQFLWKLPSALFCTRRLLNQIQPDVVIGVGGYATVLPVLLARLRGVPTWIHEAERRPGLANYLLSFVATRVSVAFEDTVLPLPKKKVFTGHPLRPDLVELADKAPQFGLPLHVLVLGGSQGADSMDRAMIDIAPQLSVQDCEILHQARPSNVEFVRAGYREAGCKAQVIPFIADMKEAFRWAHLVVSRSGAGSVMEIGVVNRPAILVPFPFSQGNHQEVNANLLAERGKAIVVSEGDAFPSRLHAAILKLSDPTEYRAMVERPAMDRSKCAARTIAQQAMALVS